MTTFSALGLSEPLLRAVEDQGFTSPTPIQTKAIPHLMQGRDITGMAQTGGGKTAAFVLPMLHTILEEDLRFESKSPIAVILAPTRELAAQIGETVRLLSRHTNIRHVIISGGTPFKPQIKALERGVHILIATPGRLQDHVRRGNVKFAHTRFFMLDEADRMLDMGFVDEVKDISKKLPAKHQTVLFSATMHKSIRKLSESLQQDPIRVEVEKDTGVADTIHHKVMHVKREYKTELLMQLLEQELENTPDNLTLVFTRTKMDADKLTKQLDRVGYQVDALHGDKPQRKRQQILRAFKNGDINILVATDVAARGIDVKNIGLVINYDMPLESENYIHRVGRTGRAGEKGLAVSFCSPGDVRLLVNIQELLKKQIEVDSEHAWHHEPGKSRHKSKDFGGHKKSHKGPRSNPNHVSQRRNKRSNDENSSFVKDRSDFKAKSKPKDNFKKRDERPSRNDRPKRAEFKKRDERPSRDDRPKRAEFKKRDERPSRDDRPKRAEFIKRDERPSRDDRPKRAEFSKPKRNDAYKAHHKRLDRKMSDEAALKRLLETGETPQQTRASLKSKGESKGEKRPIKVKVKGKLKNKGKSKKLKNRKSNAKSTEGGFGFVKRK